MFRTIAVIAVLALAACDSSAEPQVSVVEARDAWITQCKDRPSSCYGDIVVMANRRMLVFGPGSLIHDDPRILTAGELMAGQESFVQRVFPLNCDFTRQRVQRDVSDYEYVSCAYHRGSDSMQ